MKAIATLRLALFSNPVLGRELTERMRGWRAWVVLTIYLGLLVGVLALVYNARSGTGIDPFGAPAVLRLAGVGRAIFEWIVFFMLLLVLFFVPGLTADAVAGERERQTLVPLQVTLLSPRAIVAGKVGASLAFLVLLAIATLPVLAVTYLIGGVTVARLFAAVLAVVATGLVVACISVACSALFRRVQVATVLAYGITGVLAVGSFAVYGAAAAFDQARGNDPADPPVELLLANPLVATADLLGSTASTGGVGTPLNPMKDLVDDDDSSFRAEVGDVAVFGGRDDVLVERGLAPPQPMPRNGDRGFPFWAKSALTLLAVSVLSFLLAARRLRTPAREER